MVVFLLDLLLTVFIYLLVPTIYCMVGKPRTKTQIKRIVTINGACVWLICIFIRSALGNPGTSAAVFLWSFVADKIMTDRLLVEEENTEEKEVRENAPQEAENLPEPTPKSNDDTLQSKPLFCRKCGEKLAEDGVFCRKCGAKIAEIQKGGNENDL